MSTIFDLKNGGCAHPDDLFKVLDSLDISYTTWEHPAVFTVEEAREQCSNIPGAHAKNLFFKDKKSRYFLVVTLADKPIRIKAVSKTIGAKTLSFASPERLREVLGVIPGSVTPFAAMNIKDQDVRVILDEDLMAESLLTFHPLVNTATTGISNTDLVRFLESCGRPPEIIKL